MQSVLSQQHPVVSILIPAYNVAAYLSQCLNSIVNQTYQYLQVVVVDDGSKDNTLEIARQYAEKYAFVEVHYQENAGVATARNALISLATGDYVLFVDSDDWIEYDMVECMLKVLGESQSNIVVCGCFKELNGTSIINSVANKGYVIEGAEEIMKTFLMHKELNGSLCNKIVPRKYFEGLTFRKDIWYGEDCLFFWQVLNRGVEKISFMPDCLYHYRMNEQSISHEKFNFKKMTGHEVWKQINEDVDKNWSSLSCIAKATYVQQDIMLLYFAALSNYPCDDKLKAIRKNVRENYHYMKEIGISNPRRLLLGYSLGYAYPIVSKLAKAFVVLTFNKKICE